MVTELPSAMVWVSFCDDCIDGFAWIVGCKDNSHVFSNREKGAVMKATTDSIARVLAERGMDPGRGSFVSYLVTVERANEEPEFLAKLKKAKPGALLIGWTDTPDHAMQISSYSRARRIREDVGKGSLVSWLIDYNNRWLVIFDPERFVSGHGAN